MRTLKNLLQKGWASHDATALTGLDIALANLLHSKQPTDDPRHLWLAALTSHQWGRGHACLDVEALKQQPAALLSWSSEQVTRIPGDLVHALPTLPWTQGDASPLVHTIDTQGERLYLRRAWTAEQTVRQQLQARLALPCEVPTDLPQRLDALFPATQASGTDPQRRACEVAAQNKITLITGGPGTGKTTTVVRLLALLVGMAAKNLHIHLAAPTGKAAARLTESIRHALRQMPADLQAHIPTQAQTLHRLLQSSNSPPTVKELVADVVVVDEASMVDLEMMARLLQAVPTTARLILLGDKDQLASVEAGAVMSQLCNGRLLQHQTVTLTHSHRFDAHSGIGQWAQAVNHASANNSAALKALWDATPDWLDPLLDTPTQSDVTRLQVSHARHPRLSQALRQGWQTWLGMLSPHQSLGTQTPAPCSDVQAAALLKAFQAFCVLCAVREGPQGVTQLNTQIETALGLGSGPWYTGRPVMVTRNDYALNLMNGDVGLCLPCPDGVQRVAFPADEGSVRWVMPSRLESVETVFAMTVHKSQGSEFAHVLLVLPAQTSPVLTRELVYTGLTRAKQRLTWWVPDESVLFHACARRVLRSGGLSE